MPPPPPLQSTPNGIAALLQQAVQLHQAGRLAEAERIYDSVLTHAPAQGDALNLKGVIALDQGRVQEAVDLSARAAAAMPASASVHFNSGNALAASGAHQKALAAYRKALALDPAFAGAYLNAGTLLEKLGERAEAITIFQSMIGACANDPRGYRNLALCLVNEMAARGASLDVDSKDILSRQAFDAFAYACAIDSNNAELWFEYANLAAQHQHYDEAVQLFERALKLKPAWAEALSAMGECLRHAERFDEAVSTQRRALALRPNDPSIRGCLANALLKAGSYQEAEKIFRGLLAEDTNAILPYMNLGYLFKEMDRPEDAIAMFDEVLFRAPDSSEAYTNLGAIFAEQGWFAAANVLHKKAVALRGATPKTRMNMGMVALSLGRFTEGWADYEYRFDAAGERIMRRPAPPPYWRGENLTGKSIFVWTEQGIGDEMLYASMLPDAIAHARQCVIACSPRMVPIFARAFPSCEIRALESSAAQANIGAACDYQISLASLGQYCRPDFASFPRHSGYLRPDAARIADLRGRYEMLAQGRRIVGLSWRSKAPNGLAKSMELRDLAPLLSVPGLFFVNLQYGDCEAERAAVHAQLGIEVYQDATIDPLQDMEAFLAQVGAMDLVVTTSNTTAHTAGAQGIPVWVMLPFSKGLHWYWFLRHAASVWYPSARLFRPPQLERNRPWWQDIPQRVATELAAWEATSKAKSNSI